MKAASMAATLPPKSENWDSAKCFRASEACSICLETVVDSGERSIAKLKCGHHFHLDCIGSAFNAKGIMQCPNCRRVENGEWLYANGLRRNDDVSLEDIAYEDDYEVYQAMPELAGDGSGGLEEFGLTHLDWCPYRYLHPGLPEVQFSLGDTDDGGFPDLIVNVLYNMNEGGSANNFPVCPHLAAEGLRHVRPPHVPDEPRPQPPSGHGHLHMVDVMPTNGRPSLREAGLLGSPNRDIWARHDPGSSFDAYSDLPGTVPVMSDGTRFFSEPEQLWLPQNPTPRNATSSVYAGTGMPSLYGVPGPGLSPHDRLGNLWSRPDTERASGLATGRPPNTYGPVSGQYGYPGSDSLPVPDAGVSTPCLRPSYDGPGTFAVYSNQQSSPVRSGAIGAIGPPNGNSRSRLGGNPLHYVSSLRTAPTRYLPGDASRRFVSHWSDVAADIGPNHTPSLEHQRPGIHVDDRGFAWRRDMASPGTSSSLWRGNTEAQMRPRVPNTSDQASGDMQYSSFRHGDVPNVTDEHGGTSRLTESQFHDGQRNSLPMHYQSFARPPTEVGTSSSHNFQRVQR